jgi:RimJ/RimL family protein N-acetyltransferase
MLTGNKMYLRILEETDLEKTLGWINDPDLMVLMGVRGPKTLMMQKRWFEELNKNSDKIIFAICIKESDEHIGNVSLYSIDLIHRNAGLSIFIFDKKFHHKGYGTEALILLLEYAFNYLNLHRVYCKTSSEYKEAMNIYRKLGFCEEGKLRQHEFHKGEYIDKIIMGLIKNDFKKDH